MKKTILLAAVLGLLSTFSYAQPFESYDSFKEQQTNEATIHLYRTKSLYGFLGNLKLKVGNQKVKLWNGEHEVLKIKPKEIKLEMKDIGRKKLKLQLEPGEEYYVQIYLRRSFFWAIPELAEVTPRFGQQQIEKLSKK